LLRATGPQAFENAYGFSTKRRDATTGAVLYEFRVYLPWRGTWLNRDPLEERGGRNLYAFVYNNPNSFVDTDGRYGWSDLQNDWNGVKDWAGDAWDRTAGTWDNAVFFKDWVFEQGKANREYGENDRLTRLLMESNGAKDMVAQFRAKSCPPNFAGGYDTIQGYKDTFFHWGFLNPAEWQIGGFLFTVTRVGPCKVKYVVTNSATRRSFFGEPTLRRWANRVGINWTPWGLHPRDEVSWGGEIKQTFTWTDVDPCCCGKKKTRQE
jgi:RHS repeat-associated protein